MMTVSYLLATQKHKMEQAGIATARLDCLILLEDVLRRDRSWILAHPEYELTNEEMNTLKHKIKRRISHEPLAYIRSKSEFYGREFIVSKATLEPRPETETMIELFLREIHNAQSALCSSVKQREEFCIIDVGTGTGCLAVTSSLEVSKITHIKPAISVYGIDISEATLLIAKKNAIKHAADVTFLQGNLLEPLGLAINPRSLFVILANLPYVPDDYAINKAAQHEPKHAIFGGKDGLNLYRDLFTQINTNYLPETPMHIYTESLPSQHKALADIAKAAGFTLKETQGYIQVFTR